jgi:hypothetical protein
LPTSDEFADSNIATSADAAQDQFLERQQVKMPPGR